MRTVRAFVILAVVGALAAGVALLAVESGKFDAMGANKAYTEDLLQVDARIEADGSMLVMETRDLSFYGEYSRFRRVIPHKKLGSIRNIKAAEAAGPLRFDPENRGRPGTYSVGVSGEGASAQTTIELFFAAHNEKKRLMIEYQVTDVVAVYHDVAELYWQFIGAPRSVPIAKMKVLLTLPQGAAGDEVKAWGHGPVRGEVEKISDTQVVWQTADLSVKDFLEGRVVFPKRLVPQAGTIIPLSGLESILGEEADFAKARADEKKAALLALGGALSFFLAGIGFSLWLARKYCRRTVPPTPIDYLREPPGQYSPAEVSWLIEKKAFKMHSISATILDLALRKVLQIQPGNHKGIPDILISRLKKGDATLKEHEQLLLEFLFEKVGNGEPEAWFGEVVAYQKQYPLRVKVFFDSFKTALQSAAEKHGFFGEHSRDRNLLMYSGLAICCAVLVFALIARQLYFGISAALCSVAILTAIYKTYIYSEKGQVQYDSWQAFKRYLQDFSNLDKATVPQLVLWEHYLVYAVVLGVASEVVRQLPLVYPRIDSPESKFGSVWGYHQTTTDIDALQAISSGIGSTLEELLLTFQRDLDLIATSLDSGGVWGSSSDGSGASGRETSSSSAGGSFSSGGGGGGGGTSDAD